MKSIVVALGGNALGNSPKEQLEAVKGSSKSIADIIESYDKVAVVPVSYTHLTLPTICSV